MRTKQTWRTILAGILLMVTVGCSTTMRPQNDPTYDVVLDPEAEVFIE